MSENHHDYIVIGSGAAGGVVAHNLQANGADVLLIEAGKHFRKDTFPLNEADVAAQLYWGGGMEFNKDASMGFLRARMVGGTTIVNQALLDRFDDIAFNDWKAQSNVSFFNTSDMDAYYQKVESFLSCYTFNDSEFNTSAKNFTNACNQLGIKWKHLRRGQDDCGREKGNDCIACLGGCHRDSKQSSMATYIKKAEGFGLKISAETEVDKIVEKSGYTEIHALKKGIKTIFKANKLILCAGSFGTTQILLKSGLKEKYAALGKYFATHPQFMSFARYDEPINAHKGFFQTVASADPNLRAKGFKLENVYAPPVSLAVLFPDTGIEHQRLMKNYTHYTCMEVAVRDENVGELKIDNKGKLIINKPLTDQDHRRKDEGYELVKQLMTVSGAKEIILSPIYFGLHLMGGAVIGTDEKNSVVNPDFKLHHNPNIYVVDSSIFPNAPGINPSLSIFALGQKLSEELK